MQAPTGPPTDHDEIIRADVKTLESMGYAQELSRRLHGFSNFAMSFSIICILAGGLTSFHLGFCSVGGAAIGIGWPLSCGFSFLVAITMAQLASAFPTAGGLYHWSTILGGKSWGWATAWFNLAGLVTVLAAINVGTFQFFAGSFHEELAKSQTAQLVAMILITGTQALLNHLGIRLTSLLTDFSGYWILLIAVALTALMFGFAGSYDWTRLVTFANYSGSRGNEVWPATNNVVVLFLLGLMLPAYTITGFDASAHTAEETVSAVVNVPRGIIRSVVVSGLFGWAMLIAIVLAIPDMDEAAQQGSGVFFWTIRHVLPAAEEKVLCGCIVVAQYLCGLATVTSASRMTYAFARDNGLPFSPTLRTVHATYLTPVAAIWAVAACAIAFTVYTPVYSTITAVCTIFLYISYVLPTALGFVYYQRSWRHMGPWQLGHWYRPAAAASVLGCLGLIAIGMQPPNEKTVIVVGGTVLALAIWWILWERRSFAGPPDALFEYCRKADDDG